MSAHSDHFTATVENHEYQFLLRDSTIEEMKANAIASGQKRNTRYNIVLHEIQGRLQSTQIALKTAHDNSEEKLRQVVSNKNVEYGMAVRMLMRS